MYIKIYNKSQLILLEQINPLLGKYRLPLELLKEVEKILVCEKIHSFFPRTVQKRLVTAVVSWKTCRQFC